MTDFGEVSWRWDERVRTLSIMWDREGRLMILTLLEEEARRLHTELSMWLSQEHPSGEE